MGVLAAVVLTVAPAAPATAHTFTNAAPIDLPGPGSGVSAPTPGAPYPSNIGISNLPGTVIDVNVTLHGLDFG